MKKNVIYIIGFVLFVIINYNLDCNVIETKYKYNYFYFPKEYMKWDYKFFTGVSVSRLPTVVVEEEISQSPMINLGFRIGLPWNISSLWQFNSNYIANYGNTALLWSYTYGRSTLSLGAKFAIWFGHLEMDAIHLKSYGWILNPTIIYGIDFNDFVISADFETQHSKMLTFSEDEYLGAIKEPSAGFAVKLNIEQPLWKDNCISLGIKVNYAKFYYQSWLSFNTIDVYLFYPEIIFGFIL